MPGSFELDADARIVRARAWGIITDDDLLDHMEETRQLFRDGTLDASWAQIADFSAVESLDATNEGIRRHAVLNPWPEESFRALVMPTDASFGLGRMYEMLCGDQGANVRVFRSEAEALAWIAQQRKSSTQAT
jgi:hypothetical protein